MTPPNETTNPAPDAADPPACAADLSEVRRRAKQALAARRDAQQEIASRIEAELDELSEQLAEELERRRTETEQEARARVDEERGDLDAARQEFEEQREEWEQVCGDVEKELADREHRLAEREQETEQAAASTKQERRELDRWAGELADERLAIESERRDAADDARGGGDATAALEAANNRADKAVAEREALANELAAAERASAASAEALEADNQSLRERISQIEADLASAATDGDAADQLHELRAQHDEATAAWQAERATLTESLAAAADELARAQQQNNASDAERQSKFDLALEDAERHRSRVDELEQELAARPAAGAAELAELAQLRGERDDLAEQLEAARSTAPLDGFDGDQETEDLRRRFEMAVEDVRQLKTEKAELEQQLAAGGAPASGGGDGLDWEAQKRRMLAELEGEAPPVDEPRREERATIEGTIRITDEVVAEKEREIASLREQLEAAPVAAPVEPSEPENPLSDDERLDAERERLATLESEWNDKLRAAELELSVERAKIAREQAELAEWRIELESMRGSAQQSSTKNDGDGKSQRRWLDKLGLGGGE